MMEILFSFLEALTAIRILKNAYRDKPPGERPTAEGHENLSAVVMQWMNLFEKHGFDELAIQAFHLCDKYRRHTNGQIATRLEIIHDRFESQLGQRSAYVLDIGGADHPIDTLEIGESFPSAAEEVTEAGLCYALGRHTSCVFHLMRAVERLLRSFVLGLGVQPQHDAIPLEYQFWNDLIEAAEREVGRLLREGWGKENKAAYERAKSVLRSSISDFRRFKDSVRNVVFHTRSNLLSAADAESEMRRVEESFSRLLPYLSEDSAEGALLERELWRSEP